ncbi:MAG: V-type ATP synthase subunit I [Thermoplasmatota archaeon]
MRKTQLVVYQQYVDELILALHRSGFMQITNISREYKDILENASAGSVDAELESLSMYELRVSRVIDILKKAKTSKKGLKAVLKPEKTPEAMVVEQKNIDELYSYTETVLHSIEKEVISFEETLHKIDEEVEKITALSNQLHYMKDFDVDVSFLGESKYVAMYAGLTIDNDVLQKKIDEIELADMVSKKFGSGKKTCWAVVLFCHISVKEKISKILKEHVSIFDFSGYSGKAVEVLSELTAKKNDVKKEKIHILGKLRQYKQKRYHYLLSLREEITLEKNRREITKNFASTQSTSIITGWVLQEYQKELTEIVEQTTKNHCICEFKTPQSNPDDPPIYLKNPRWAKSFQTFLELFATPKYNELNPTIFMGVFFVLFFGLMLGDAGYGGIILLLSLFGYFRFGKKSAMIQDWSMLGIMLGSITIIVGVLTNSIFGDLFPRFFNIGIPAMTIYGFTLPLDPLRNPLVILTIALIGGIIHLNVGIILGILQSIHTKSYKKLITKYFNWIPLQIGGGLLIGNFILEWKVEGVLFYIAITLTLVGVVLLFINAGPIGFFDITGYVGDWLSYARLLALGLATAGMALAFNVVAEMIGDMIPVIGVVITGVLLVFAHIVNLILQALGAGVHSLRLQYVEFFNRFYEGGGKTFSPFKIKRRYTKLKEK